MIAILLAEAAATVAPVAPTAMQTYGPAAALVIALGGWKGLAQTILWLQGRGGNGNSKRRAIDERACDRRHEEEAKLRAAEMAPLTRSIDKLDGSVTRLHERIDEFLGRQGGRPN